MADLVIGEVDVSSNARTKQGIAGEILAAGQLVYVDLLDGNKIKLAQADDILTAKIAGMTINSAEIGQPVDYVGLGAINISAVATVGTGYFLSAAAAGGVAPEADLLATNIAQFFAIATAAGVLQAAPLNSNAVKP